ncbi:MAG: beta-lactamase family protein [Bacteroidetes bacterium]|nr:beta-lactamase family protein [Bacteroidota bacterium]
MLRIISLALVLLHTACKKEPVGVNLYFPPAGITEWQSVTPATLGWNVSAIPALTEMLEENGTRAFILLKNGKIVMEYYYGTNLTGTAPFSVSTYWYWASAGKTLTAFIVGKAAEDGVLSINDKSSEYLGTGWTSLTPAQENAITIRHQLTMTTGLDDGVADNHNFQPASMIYKAPAGTRWAYHNAPYSILEHVVTNATGENFTTHFERVLGDRIGMDGFWSWIDYDNVFFSTARSMARFGLLMLNNGDWNGATVMGDKVFLKEMITTSQSINKGYGYLWWLNGKESFMVPEMQTVFPGNMTPNGPTDMYSGIGKNGQYVSVVPSQNLVLVRMGENPDAVAVPFLFLDEIWKKLNLIIR